MKIIDGTAMINDEDQVLFVRIHFVTETENLTNPRGNRSTRLPFSYSDTQEAVQGDHL